MTTQKKWIPFSWVSFCDSRNDIDGYAADWFFWVFKSLKPALDVFYVEAIDENNTAARRDKMSQKLFGLTQQELKDKIKNSGAKLGDSDEYKRVMRYNYTNMIEVEGSPLLFAFREADSLESRCGNWLVQVVRAATATQDNSGEIIFYLFRRTAQGSKLMWERDSQHGTTQEDFVNLLKNGTCSRVNLTNAHWQYGS